LQFFNNKRSSIKFFSVVLAILLLSNVPASAGIVISPDHTIDTPDRTLTYQDKTYEINDIGAYLLGESPNISINVTDINSFELSLLDKNENFLWNHVVYYTEGSAEATMPADVVTTPGTYVLVILYQGDILAFKPVVFSQNNISVIPDSTTVAPGGSLHVKVKVMPDTSLPIKVVLSRNSSSLESVVNRTQEGLYETEIKIPFSASGRFSLYAAIVSDNMVLGYPELMGVSSGGAINVTEIPPSPPSKSVDYSLTITFIFLAGLLILVYKKVRS
jgi:hypothetical protein